MPITPPSGAELKTVKFLGPLPWGQGDGEALVIETPSPGWTSGNPIDAWSWVGYQQGPTIDNLTSPTLPSSGVYDSGARNFGPSGETPYIDTIQACEPFWRVSRWKMSWNLIWHSDTGGGDTTDAGFIHLVPTPSAAGVASGYTDEALLPFCNRVESVTTGSETPLIRFCALFARVAYAPTLAGVPGGRATTPTIMLVHFPAPGHGSILVFGDATEFGHAGAATFSFSAGSHWPDNAYTLQCVTYSDYVGYEPVGWAEGTVTVEPDTYYSWGGKFNTSTGDPI